MFFHGNDFTLRAFLIRDEQKLVTKSISRNKEVLIREEDWDKRNLEAAAVAVFEPSAGPFLPAKIGDEIRINDGGRWRHVVTAADIRRGWVSRGSYKGVRFGTLEMPVFIRARRYYEPGDAGWPSESEME